jgi:hypothetical protein
MIKALMILYVVAGFSAIIYAFHSLWITRKPYSAWAKQICNKLAARRNTINSKIYDR